MRYGVMPFNVCRRVAIPVTLASIVWVCVSLLGVGHAAANVTLQVGAVKSTLLVGEPLVLMVTVKTTADVALEADLTEPTDALKVLIDRGQGFVPYREKRWTSDWRDPGKGPIDGGQRTLEYVLSYDANLKDWVFPAPGTYRVVVEYQDKDIGPFRSNVLTLTVQAPTGDEKAVHDSLRQMGPGSIGVHQPDRLGPLKPLVDRYSSSVYLQESRINDLNARLSKIMGGYDPDEIVEGGTPDNPPKRPDLRPEIVRERLSTLVPDAEAVASVPGPFQPDAVLMLAGLYDSTGNEVAARQLYERIVREFPDRQAARLALEEVGDTTPPTLQVSAAPASLWPPNHKLVSIGVAVEVSDERDPSPEVKLVSITCDDACDSALDIVGATYGTDDRQFDLRSERKGTSQVGRTYTITYSAEDAAGNKSTAETKVMIAHDQGKKK